MMKIKQFIIIIKRVMVRVSVGILRISKILLNALKQVRFLDLKIYQLEKRIQQGILQEITRYRKEIENNIPIT